MGGQNSGMCCRYVWEVKTQGCATVTYEESELRECDNVACGKSNLRDVVPLCMGRQISGMCLRCLWEVRTQGCVVVICRKLELRGCEIIVCQKSELRECETMAYRKSEPRSREILNSGETALFSSTCSDRKGRSNLPSCGAEKRTCIADVLIK
ncbi:hypothetical protein PoB_001095700 [Plakobranchus ocellatus]|uniref:Uncharacterized protein n=1 Tax=Plakobranchus ocellatus TaxID=259542 RepID=A0AAV3YND7_9GAST|nr:hypothetical protein PoB_001095700 [Plakobranchus ocellatus]